MLETKEYMPVESYTRIGNAIQRAKTTKYLRKIEKEIKYLKLEQQTIEERLKFLYEEQEKALFFNLLH